MTPQQKVDSLFEELEPSERLRLLRFFKSKWCVQSEPMPIKRKSGGGDGPGIKESKMTHAVGRL